MPKQTLVFQLCIQVLGKTCDELYKCPTELFRNRNTVTFYYRGHQTVMHLNLTLRIQ